MWLAGLAAGEPGRKFVRLIKMRRLLALQEWQRTRTDSGGARWRRLASMEGLGGARLARLPSRGNADVIDPCCRRGVACGARVSVAGRDRHCAAAPEFRAAGDFAGRQSDRLRFRWWDLASCGHGRRGTSAGQGQRRRLAPAVLVRWQQARVRVGCDRRWRHLRAGHRERPAFAVDHRVFVVRVLRQSFKHVLPDSRSAPAAMPQVDHAKIVEPFS